MNSCTWIFWYIIKVESSKLYGLKQHKPWFDEGCSHLLDQRKANMEWLQDSNQSNVDNLNNVSCEASRHFRNKKKKSLKAKIYELEANSKIKNIRDLYRGINEMKMGYLPRTNVVKDKKGDMVTDSHTRSRNHSLSY